MAYVRDGDILASDINTFRQQVMDVYGFGGTVNGAPDGTYGCGQSIIVVPQKNINDDILAADWLNLRNMISSCASHQGTTVSLPAGTEFVALHDILAYPPNPGDIPAAITAIRTNRNKMAPTSAVLFSDQLISTRTTAWASQLTFTFTATFANPDQARNYFNSGGEIRIRGSRTGGTVTAPTGDHNKYWTNVLAKAGSVRFGVNSTTNGISTVAIGYYQITGVYQTIFQQALGNSGTAYATNAYTISVKRNDAVTTGGANGVQLQFQVQYTDTFTPTPDTVDGTLTANVDIYKGTNPFTIISPTLATVHALTAGAPYGV